MYPGFIPHWKSARCGNAEIGVGWGRCGGARREGSVEFSDDDSGEFGGHAPFGFGGVLFGVRRPLRFMAYKLGLDEAQVSALARILDEIKTERAQAAVDHRRAISAFADAIEAEVFDEKRAEAGASIRMQSAERLRDAVFSALQRHHKLLSPEQRSRLAYLIRTGVVSI
jgi:Spy/CpxP family protein refolding chaperone